MARKIKKNPRDEIFECNAEVVCWHLSATSKSKLSNQFEERVYSCDIRAKYDTCSDDATV